MNSLTTTNKSKLIISDDLSSAFADFLRLNVANGDASPKTIASYQTEVRQYSQWCETEGVNPARASENDLIEYRHHLIDFGYTRGTIATKLAAIRRFYEAAKWRGLRTDNPASGLKAPKDKSAAEDKIKFLPLPGFKQLLNITDNDRDRAILALMGLQGLRVAEVANLTLSDMNLNDNPATIYFVGKGSKRRKVHLVDSTLKAIRAWLKVRPETDSDILFISQARNTSPGPMTTRAIRYLVDKYLDQAGLKDEGVSCHSLRHSYATWSRFAGAKLGAIAAEMGHSSTKTTEGYARIVDRIKENPAGYLETLLTSA